MTCRTHYFVLLMIVTACNAATVTWTGGGTDNLWNDGANWAGGVPPTKDDNVVINGGRVLLGQVRGGFAAGLHLTRTDLEIRGSTLSVSSLTMSGSQLAINAGAGSLNVTHGKAVVDAKSGITWGSGKIFGGTWQLSGSFQTTVVNGGALECDKATFSIATTGTFAVPNATALTFNCPVTNKGTISFARGSASNGASLIEKFTTTLSSTGQVKVSDGPIQFRTAELKNVEVSANALMVLNLGKSALINLKVDGGAMLKVQQSEVSISHATGKGSIEVDVGSMVDITGVCEVAFLHCASGGCVLKDVPRGRAVVHTTAVTGGTGTLDLTETPQLQVVNMTTSGGTVTLGKGGVVEANTMYVPHNDAFFMGEGTATTHDLMAKGFFKLAINLTVTSKVALESPNVALDARLTIVKDATLTVPGGSNPTVGPSNSSHPTGQLDIFGNVIVESNATFTLNGVTFNTTGKPFGEWGVIGTLHVEGLTFAAHEVALGPKGTWQADGSTLKVTTLSGPKAGDKIQILSDAGLSSCTSPCAGPNQFYQSYQARVL